MSVKQRVCVNGQSRLKHGEQSRFNDIIRALLLSGGVKLGSDEPYNAIIFLSSAAATCIKPESFVTTVLTSDIKSTACANDVSPAKLRHKP